MMRPCKRCSFRGCKSNSSTSNVGRSPGSQRRSVEVNEAAETSAVTETFYGRRIPVHLCGQTGRRAADNFSLLLLDNLRPNERLVSWRTDATNEQKLRILIERDDFSNANRTPSVSLSTATGL